VFYGNIIVSLFSGTLDGRGGLMASPLFTDGFTSFLKSKMGGDYRQGMCIQAARQEISANEVPIVIPEKRPMQPK
jgi:hypothetical protein